MGERVDIYLDKFKPRAYQDCLFDAVFKKQYKRIMAIWPRRAGKDLTAWNICIRQLITKPCVIFYVFPTFALGRRILWDALTIDGYRVLDYLPKELIDSKNEQLMRIRLVNGSLFQVLGSDKFDKSMIGTNAHGMVFSEFAVSEPLSYSLSLPILDSSDGWAMIVSCVAPDTLVIGSHGLKRIKDISYAREEYSSLNVPIYGLNGFHNAEQFYYGGTQKTLKIILASGYELECTRVHPIWNGSEWVKAADLKVGDLVPIQYGQNIFGEGLDVSEEFIYDTNWRSSSFPFDLDSDDFFYFLGLMHADGNYSNNTVCITNKMDPEIIQFLHSYGFRTRTDGIHHEKSSRELCALLEFLGYKHGALNKVFPDTLLDCNKKQLTAFLSGLFDGDGTSNSHPSKRGRIKLTSTCISFLKDLQVLLLNFGIVSSIYKEEKAPTKKVKVWSTIYNLEIYGYFAHVFYRDIGFRLERKQKNWKHVPDNNKLDHNNIYPVDEKRLPYIPQRFVSNKSRIGRRTLKKLKERYDIPYLDDLLRENFYYSPIKEIIDSENEVYDFVIPDTHSFFSNGFISHNTPRGKNFLYDMYNVALDNLDHWFVSKLTVDDTKHVSLEKILKSRETGEMSEDLQLQEYWTSFDLGVEGSYYIKYLDKLSLSGQIGSVPWNPTYKVHTSWDIGCNDMTSIIFFQVINNNIHIIDCYENNKQGMEYYIKLLKDKPYVYGKHIAPHDMNNMSFSTGMTRWQKAKDLGIIFTVVDKLSIEDGIEAVRTVLPRCWFDEKNAAGLLKALQNYRQEYDSKRKVYKEHPYHDINSNYADSMRYLSVGLNLVRETYTPEEIEKDYAEAMYGHQSSIPRFFRDR